MFYWEAQFDRQKYWTLKSSLIRWPNLWDLLAMINHNCFLTHFYTVVQLCCFCLFSLYRFCLCDLSLCLCFRTCWTSMTRWILMQQNIIWETRSGFTVLVRHIQGDCHLIFMAVYSDDPPAKPPHSVSDMLIVSIIILIPWVLLVACIEMYLEKTVLAFVGGIMW